jgi:hypothetical protein
MAFNEFIRILEIVIWPTVVLVGIAVLRSHLAALLPGAKVRLSLWGQSIETTIPDLKRIIEEQLGGSLTVEEIQYLEQLDQHGQKDYPTGMESQERKLIRPLRNFGLVMTLPRNAFLDDAKSIQLTPLGRLYMEARRKNIKGTSK